jgi:alkyl sulfatase BDS1-like metallo-beta-lactamase superfamily hydrolase
VGAGAARPGSSRRASSLRRRDYRSVAEILHEVVFADPDNTEAQTLQADGYEQMGYQTGGP